MVPSDAKDLDFGARLPIVDVLRRIAAVWCALLLVSAMASMAQQGLLTSAAGIIWGLAWLAVTMLWWLCLVRTHLPPPLFVTSSAVVALAAVAVTGATGPGAAVTNVWLQLSCVAAALTLPTLWARSTVVAVSGSAAAVMLVLVDPLTWHTGLESFSQAFDALVVGMVVLAGAQGLKLASQRYDVRQREAVLAASAATSAEEFARLAHRSAFQLHDTAINTLGAVATGIDPVSAPSVRVRAAHDLTVLAGLDSHVQDAAGYAWSVATETLADAVQARADTLGINVVVEVQQAEPGGSQVMPAATLEGLCDCVFAILRRPPDRMGAASIAVTVAGNPLRGTVTVSRQGTGQELGLSTSQRQDLRRRAQLSGLDVDSAGGSPSTVTLAWDRGDDTPTALLSPGIVTSTVPLMLARMCAWLFSLYLLATLVVYVNIGQLLPLLTLGAAGLLSVWALRAAFRGVPVTAVVAGVLLVAVPVVTLAPAFGLEGCVGAGQVYWTANGGLIAVVLVVLLAPGRLFVWAGVTLYLGCAAGLSVWMAFGLGCQDSGLSAALINGAAIVAAIMLRRFLRQRDYAAAHLVRQTRESQAHRETSEFFVSSGRAAADAVMAPSLEVLGALADGALNPHDDLVRAQARREESYLRALAGVEPDMGALVAPFLELITSARTAGVCIKLAKVGAPRQEASPADAATIQRVVAAAISELPPDSVVRLSVFSGDTGNEVTVVTDCPVETPNGVDGGVSVQVEQVESQTRIQLNW